MARLLTTRDKEDRVDSLLSLSGSQFGLSAFAKGMNDENTFNPRKSLGFGLANFHVKGLMWAPQQHPGLQPAGWEADCSDFSWQR